MEGSWFAAEGHDHDRHQAASVRPQSWSIATRRRPRPIAKSHFHALWLLSRGYDIEETAEILSFSTRWVRSLIKRYNEGGAERLGDQRVHNGTEPTILTAAALAALKERLKTPPDDGGQWTGPKIARWLAQFHGLESVHDQRGWDALIAVSYSIQQRSSSKCWRGSFEERRCLVPATSFCEPNGDVKPATWHWFAINGGDPRPTFAFPGIWRRYNGPVRKDGPNVEMEVYAFLTTTPNALVATVNHERMPVLLTREDEFETWLKGSTEEALALAREYPPSEMQIVQEGFYKEDRLDIAA